tara:strand:+ start:98 stop:469 length:372 start_codon:yes stop_codon:yes gene_type:complete
MNQLFLIIHLLVALAIIGLIMLQQGKGADVGASFGAGASQTLFGSDGSGNVIAKTTAWLSAVFFATSFGLAVIATKNTQIENQIGLEIPIVNDQAGSSELGLDVDIPVSNDSSSSKEDDLPDL